MPIRQPEAWVGGEMLPVYTISTEMPKKISGFKKIAVFLIFIHRYRSIDTSKASFGFFAEENFNRLKERRR